MEAARREMERDVAILKLIATQGPLNKYNIWLKLQSKKLGTEPTILAAIEELEQIGFVQPARTDTEARGGRPSKWYDLTLAGVLWLMRGIAFLEPEKLESSVTYLAEKYDALLPEIFHHWQNYKAQNVEDMALEALAEEVDPPDYVGFKHNSIRWRELERTNQYWQDRAELEAEGAKRQAHDFFLRVEHQWIVKPEKWERWLKAMKEDSDLRGPFLSYLEAKKKLNLFMNAKIDKMKAKIDEMIQVVLSEEVRSLS